MRDPTEIIIVISVILFSVALHEFAHAKSADAAGDPTPRAQGRVTLNPLAHLDPIGTLFIIMTVLAGFGLGWGRPVQVNPYRMRNPKWDHFMSVLWGPLTNLILAVVFALIFRLVPPVGPTVIQVGPLDMDLLHGVAFFGTLINVALCLFNLIPIGPLDGHWLLGILLPQPMGGRFIMWSQRYGMFILLGVLLFDDFVLRKMGRPGLLDYILAEPSYFLLGLLLGRGN